MKLTLPIKKIILKKTKILPPLFLEPKIIDVKAIKKEEESERWLFYANASITIATIITIAFLIYILWMI